jgi:hypothetical protein
MANEHMFSHFLSHKSKTLQLQKNADEKLAFLKTGKK